VSASLVRGADPSLRDRAVQRLVDELLGEIDRSFGLDDHTIPPRRRGDEDDRADSEPGRDGDGGDGGDGSVEVPAFAAIANALSSPPFMTPCRVVVVREIGNLSADQARWLAGWLADPLDGVHLVLVTGGGRTPAALEKASKAHAQVVNPPAEQTADVLRLELREAGVALTPTATTRVVEHLGADAGRVPELVALWRAAYGDDAVLDLDAVDAYLGALGTAERFSLANAIDRGDVPGALETLHRLLTATAGADKKPLHPMQVMASLAYHFQSLLRLDDPAISTADHAAAALGTKPAAARFRLDAAKRLGTGGLREAMQLLAQAELDLRGASGLDERTVIEVLVARLAALQRRAARSRRPARATR
jgi:DNA polymerase-3 subunit delta